MHLFQVTFRHGPHGEIKTCYVVTTCDNSTVCSMIVNEEFGNSGRVFDVVTYEITDNTPSPVPGRPRMCFRGDAPLFVDLQRYVTKPGPCQCTPPPQGHWPPFCPN